tara:strand:+ start:1005 stop:3020 length:2016 start_codon:yes stop_codon:yes gene_type:complete
MGENTLSNYNRKKKDIKSKKRNRRLSNHEKRHPHNIHRKHSSNLIKVGDENKTRDEYQVEKGSVHNHLRGGAPKSFPAVVGGGKKTVKHHSKELAQTLKEAQETIDAARVVGDQAGRAQNILLMVMTTLGTLNKLKEADLKADEEKDWNEAVALTRAGVSIVNDELGRREEHGQMFISSSDLFDGKMEGEWDPKGLELNIPDIVGGIKKKIDSENADNPDNVSKATQYLIEMVSDQMLPDMSQGSDIFKTIKEHVNIHNEIHKPDNSKHITGKMAGTLQLDSNASSDEDFYKGCRIKIPKNSGIINTYNGSNKEITVVKWEHKKNTKPTEATTYTIEPGPKEKEPPILLMTFEQNPEKVPKLYLVPEGSESGHIKMFSNKINASFAPFRKEEDETQAETQDVNNKIIPHSFQCFIIDYHERGSEKWILIYSHLFKNGNQAFWIKWDDVKVRDDAFIFRNISEDYANNLFGKIAAEVAKAAGVVDAEEAKEAEAFNQWNHLIMNMFELLSKWHFIKSFINDEVGDQANVIGQRHGSNLYKYYFRCRWISSMIGTSTAPTNITNLIEYSRARLRDLYGKRNITVSNHNILSTTDYGNFLYNILSGYFQKGGPNDKNALKKALELEESIKVVYEFNNDGSELEEYKKKLKYIFNILISINPFLDIYCRAEIDEG